MKGIFVQDIPEGFFWGKWDSQTCESLSLIDHSADVAAVVYLLLTRTLLGERLARLAGQEELGDGQIEALCFFAALHDVGKVSIPFQRQVIPGRRESGTASHVQAALQLLKVRGHGLQKRFFARLPQSLFGSQHRAADHLRRFLVCTVCHHGRPFQPSIKSDKNLWTPKYGLDPEAEIERLIEAATRWFPKAYEPDVRLPTREDFFHAWNGVLTLADWIGSTRRFFEFPAAQSGEELSEDRMPFAGAQAAKAIHHVGLDVVDARSTLTSPPEFHRISGFSPRPAQVAVGGLELSADGSTAVLEASTGSGKTEAAMWHFSRLFQAGLVDGFYFALPTRSAATQIQRRVETIIKDHLLPHLDGTDRPAVIQAVPGYLRADGLDGERLPGFEVLWSDAREQGASEAGLRAWAAEHSKRYLAGAFVVGTIDQALLSTLRIRHCHLRAAGLLRHLLIVDEVHASDAYMGRILEEVLVHHRRSGGHAVLMSATLGSHARRRLLDAGSLSPSTALSFEQAIQVPYPTVQIRSGNRIHAPQGIPRVLAEATTLSKTVKLGAHGHGLIDQPEKIAGLALNAAALGAKVLVIRNTVAGCLAVQQALEALAADQSRCSLCFGPTPGSGNEPSTPAPHHSRYSRRDRRLLDESIETAFSPKRSEPFCGCVAVTTQTVEQSLDIDADLMITDLCPMDVLLQRIGRLHRHHLKRPPGFDTARIEVLTPDHALSDLLKEDGQARGIHGLGGKIYPDLRILEATLKGIQQREHFHLPQDCRELVERATHPDKLSSIGADQPNAEHWRNHGHQILGQGLAARGLAKLGILNWTEDRFGEVSFDSELDKTIQTRLGLQDLLVTFPTEPQGPFGQPVQQLAIRPYELGMQSDQEPDTENEPVAQHVETDDGGSVSFTFAGIPFRYDRLGTRLADSG